MEAVRDRLDKDIREVRSEISGVKTEVAGVKTEVANVRTELAETKTEIIGEMNSRFEAMHRLIIQVGGGLVGTMAIGFLGLVLTQN